MLFFFVCLEPAPDFSNMLKNQLIDLKLIYEPAMNMPIYLHLFQRLSVLQGSLHCMRWLCQHVLTFWECLAFSEACRVRRELPDAELHFGCSIPKRRAGKCVCARFTCYSEFGMEKVLTISTVHRLHNYVYSQTR